jgi:class 3 adenylate cyclase
LVSQSAGDVGGRQAPFCAPVHGDHGGRRPVLFKTIGDAVQAAFPSVPQAIAAVESQSALRKQDWGELGPLRVRMGIHVREANPKDGDYLAPALNRNSTGIRLPRVIATHLLKHGDK